MHQLAIASVNANVEGNIPRLCREVEISAEANPSYISIMRRLGDQLGLNITETTSREEEGSVLVLAELVAG